MSKKKHQRNNRGNDVVEQIEDVVVEPIAQDETFTEASPALNIEPDTEINSEILQELNLRLEETNAALEAALADNKTLTDQISDYSLLMEESVTQIEELEAKLASSSADEAALRERIVAESAAEEIQSAVRFKNELVANARAEADAILSEARAKGAATYQEIVDQAKKVAEEQHQLYMEAKERYDDTVDRLTMLGENIRATLENKARLKPISVTNTETGGNHVEPEVVVDAPASTPAAETTAPQAKAEVPKGTWAAASTGNESKRANAAADKLRARTRSNR